MQEKYVPLDTKNPNPNLTILLIFKMWRFSACIGAVIAVLLALDIILVGNPFMKYMCIMMYLVVSVSLFIYSFSIEVVAFLLRMMIFFGVSPVQANRIIRAVLPFAYMPSTGVIKKT